MINVPDVQATVPSRDEIRPGPETVTPHAWSSGLVEVFSTDELDIVFGVGGLLKERKSGIKSISFSLSAKNETDQPIYR